MATGSLVCAQWRPLAARVHAPVQRLCALHSLSNVSSSTGAIHRQTRRENGIGCSRQLSSPGFAGSTTQQRETLFTPPLVGGVLLLGLVSGGMLVYMHIENKADLKAVQDMPLISGNPIVYLDVTDGDEPLGRVIIQLRADVVPKTAENFRMLCTGALGWGYRNSPIHTVEKGRRVFSGDFFGGGASGYSIYGDYFRDEGFGLPHMGPGTVGMRNTGPNTNSSQFYITFRRLPELDGRSVVVGYVMEGFNVLEAMDKAALASGGRFGGSADYRITACGQLPAHEYVQASKRAQRSPEQEFQAEVAKLTVQHAKREPMTDKPPTAPAYK